MLSNQRRSEINLIKSERGGDRKREREGERERERERERGGRERLFGSKQEARKGI